MTNEQPPGSPESKIASLVEEFTDRLNRGEVPDPEEYAKRKPELGEEIRDVLSTLVAMRETREQPFPDAPAQTIGEYSVVRELGRGGMAVVYEAKHRSLDRSVALKIMRRTTADGMDVKRFEREARAAARLHHTNIVPVFETGSVDGDHFIAMQYIEGESLDQVILRPGRASSARTHPASLDDTDTKVPQPKTAEEHQPADEANHFQRVARIGLQIADALAHAHDRGVLHRDIKPSNLLLDDSGSAWLTDFGLATTHDESLTATGDVVGTIRYMGPERFKGQCDERSDVYSLGMTLYELAAGQPAFAEVDRLELVRAISERPCQSLCKVAPGTPRDLETIVSRATSAAPDQRFQSASELASELRRFVQGEPIHSRRETVTERVIRWTRHNPVLAGLSVALLASIVVGMSLFGWQYRRAVDANHNLIDANSALRDQTVRANAAAKQAQTERVRERFVADYLTSAFTSILPAADGQSVRIHDLLPFAVECLKKRDDIDRESRGALYASLGRALVANGYRREGRMTMQQSLDLLPAGDDYRVIAQLGIAESYNAESQPALALASLEPILDVPASSVIRNKIKLTHADALRGLQKYDEALALLDELLLDDKLPSQLRTIATCKRGAVVALSGDVRRGIDIIEEALDQHYRIGVSSSADLLEPLGAVAKACLSKRLLPPKELQSFLERSTQLHERILGESHSKTMNAIGTLSMLQSRLGNERRRVRNGIEALQNLRGQAWSAAPQYRGNSVQLGPAAYAFGASEGSDSSVGGLPRSWRSNEINRTPPDFHLPDGSCGCLRSQRRLISLGRRDFRRELLANANEDGAARQVVATRSMELARVLIQQSKFAEAEPMLPRCTCVLEIC